MAAPDGKQWVVRARRSPPNLWLLVLDCGHEVEITSRQRPKRTRVACERCRTADFDRIKREVLGE